MKWIAISGSWRLTSSQVENDVRELVREIIGRGDGIVSGGALNVDWFAVDEAMKFDERAEKTKVILPTSLEIYAAHYRMRAKEGVITEDQAERLVQQLEKIKNQNSTSLLENSETLIVNVESYYARNAKVIEFADELHAFQVNQSQGVQDTIDKARTKGIPVFIRPYVIAANP